MSVHVHTQLDFPRAWGLGSSSTLVHNIAKWANISPFELLFKTNGGSGYDIACAQSDGPIIYHKNSQETQWTKCPFNPPYRDQLYFIYLGNKVCSQKGIELYEQKVKNSSSWILKISRITEELIQVKSLKEFEQLINLHEEIISQALGIKKIKEQSFPDYWGSVKSLGAWGGDFALVTSDRSAKETSQYFSKYGLDVFIPYSDLIWSTW